ncbi:type I secretion system permease/ATPase [Paracoccus jeotgali]|uniref:type I secretion system permease/ATPase n=1 Tax=Paracoccus jeotgali TaxID=2065379 RepID=UPI0028B11FA7|nr:type I secretion system permease/ATPase [Paracoccus jeotgali]
MADRDGRAELHRAGQGSAGLLACVALFSLAVNLLMLTGPLFMLQTYDRVLVSHSVETLAALFLLVVFLFIILCIVDLARGRIMQRIALRWQDRLQARVFDAALSRGPDNAPPRGGVRDLDAVRGLIASPVALAVFDLPFAPIYLGAVFVFHPLLGGVALSGGAVLVLTTWLNQLAGRRALRELTSVGQSADRMSELFRREGELIAALGMRDASLTRWLRLRDRAAGAAVQSGDTGLLYATISRGFRMFLQSGMLAVGAWLVLRGQLSPGAMIAASILMGRALQPVEVLVAQWPRVQRAQDGWRDLAALLSRCPPVPARTALPRPVARLEIDRLDVIPPGRRLPTLRALDLVLEPGQAVGVIGTSGAGKSTLARAVIGSWPQAAGSIRLGGAALDQYAPDALGRLIGYLPQQVTLFDGSVAENIARLDPQPDAERVVQAARAADAHQMILDLSDGYDTPLSQAGAKLSGGQIQRIGLARALYTDPVLLVLDEPNANLDNEGSMALNSAIRRLKAQGGAVMIMAHRPAAIAECDLLLVLERGVVRRFGPRDEVLKSVVQNAQVIRNARMAGGVA